MFSLNTYLNFEMTRLETNPNYYFLQRKILFRMIPEKWYYRREIHSKQHDKKAIFFFAIGQNTWSKHKNIFGNQRYCKEMTDGMKIKFSYFLEEALEHI